MLLLYSVCYLKRLRLFDSHIENALASQIEDNGLMLAVINYALRIVCYFTKFFCTALYDRSRVNKDPNLIIKKKKKTHAPL